MVSGGSPLLSSDEAEHETGAGFRGIKRGQMSSLCDRLDTDRSRQASREQLGIGRRHEGIVGAPEQHDGSADAVQAALQTDVSERPHQASHRLIGPIGDYIMLVLRRIVCTARRPIRGTINLRTCCHELYAVERRLSVEIAWRFCFI